MRASMLLLPVPLMLLAACDREPSFEERYAAEANRIDTLAANMQAELETQIDAANAAGRLALPVNESDGAP